ncbi:hypothetical protein BJV82DRAFT_416098 [Fennellomyces sp. T-0311]|nr:hypothetical protein BJV82DRAFT_416098 [Fennellomyces sp. T-0311]
MQATLEGTFATLPVEITHRLLGILSDRDLVCMGRVNSWYRSMMVPILMERISHQMKNDGWRIYVNATSQFNFQDEQATLAEFWGHQEAKLLGELCDINQDTLSLEFDAMPLDEDHGFRSGPLTEEETCRSILLPRTDPRHVEVDVSLYFAKIGNDQRLERANVMGIMTLGARDICHRALVEGQFRNSANFGNSGDVSVQYSVKPSSSSIRIEFQTISASPEWWLCQIDNPYDFYMQYISEHSI